MTLTLSATAGIPQTLVSSAATRLERNCAALGIDLYLPALEFCDGRDGSSTAKRDGVWLAGCSVPRRAADVMLRNAGWPGPTICLLLPSHGQQIHACLEKLGRPHGMVVRMASIDALADAFACCDFADDIASGRLFFAWDDASFEAIFTVHPGLAVPQQMVRLPDVDTDALPHVTAATQDILGQATAALARRTLATIQSPGPVTTPQCVLAAQHFRLWNDSGAALATVCPHGLIDPTRPSTAADAHSAEAVAAAAVTITADRPRAVWAKGDRPWINWVTRGPVPPFNPAYFRDALLLADREFQTSALAAGWPADRLALAGWPASEFSTTPAAPLALVADLPPPDAPADIADLSSRQLVWDAIRDELTRDPFALGDDLHRYVARAPGRLNLPSDDFPIQRFVDTLIGPAYVLGIARWLIGQNIPLTLHGRGWTDDDRCAPHARGSVADRPAFQAIVRASGGLVDPFVAIAGHPVRAVGVPLLRTFGRTPQRVLQDAMAIRQGRLAALEGLPPLTAAIIARLVPSPGTPGEGTRIHFYRSPA